MWSRLDRWSPSPTSIAEHFGLELRAIVAGHGPRAAHDDGEGDHSSGVAYGRPPDDHPTGRRPDQVDAGGAHVVGNRDEVVSHVEVGVGHDRDLAGGQRRDDAVQIGPSRPVARRREAGVAAVHPHDPKARLDEEPYLLLGELDASDLLGSPGRG